MPSTAPVQQGYTGKLIDPSIHVWPSFEGYGTYLDPAVFPTPIYETTAAVLGICILVEHAQALEDARQNVRRLSDVQRF